jgi:hypothetical protein
LKEKQATAADATVLVWVILFLARLDGITVIEGSTMERAAQWLQCVICCKLEMVMHDLFFHRLNVIARFVDVATRQTRHNVRTVCELKSKSLQYGEPMKDTRGCRRN